MKPEECWYIEWVDHTGALRWSGFVEGFEPAWDKFVELKRACGEEDWEQFEKFGEGAGQGVVRADGPRSASDDEMMAFDDAFAFGPEPCVGYEDALAKLNGEKP